MKRRSGGIRRELIAGLLAIVVMSGAVTFIGILARTRYEFDEMVQKGDIEVAEAIAAALAPRYGARLSWDGVDDDIAALGASVLSRAAYDRAAATDGYEGGKRPKGDGIPLVITDSLGLPVSSVDGAQDRGSHGDPAPGRYDTKVGARVAWGGKTVGYVFFKSMLKPSYNPREAAFIGSLLATIGASVAMGAVLAIAMGLYMAGRFVRPVRGLDEAMQRFANGDTGARAADIRRDEIGHLAVNFNAMAEKLERTESARRNLLADIAHELRTPVSIIQANLEMILAGLYAADEQRLKSLYDETRVLTGLIGNLRRLSDLESGLAPFESVPVRIYELLAETCAKHRPLFEERGIAIDLTPSACADLRVSSDEDRLRQVIGNVLANARKYAMDGSTVTIACERVTEGGKPYARVTIGDEGPGVPEADLEKIFERFYRVDASRNRDSGGRGLGLAICRQLIEASGGSISAANREPRGLIVTFDVPEYGSA